MSMFRHPMRYELRQKCLHCQWHGYLPASRERGDDWRVRTCPRCSSWYGTRA